MIFWFLLLFLIKNIYYVNYYSTKKSPSPMVIICFYYVCPQFETMIKLYNLEFMITTILLHDYFIYLIKYLLKKATTTIVMICFCYVNYYFKKGSTQKKYPPNSNYIFLIKSSYLFHHLILLILHHLNLLYQH